MRGNKPVNQTSQFGSTTNWTKTTNKHQKRKHRLYSLPSVLLTLALLITAGLLAISQPLSVLATNSNQTHTLPLTGGLVTIDSQIAAQSSKVTQLVAGSSHSLALTESGDIYAWGYNYYGQLGNGTSGSGANQSTPVKVSQSSMTASGKVTQIAAGYYHSLALTESGDIYAWGYNNYGQLGNGTSGSGANQSTPVKVSQSSMTASGKVTQIAAGYYHSLALTESGDIYAWGYNNYGQLGNGTSGSGANQSTPVKVSQSSMTASGKVIQLTAGSSHSLALTESGDIYAWGYNNYGQLGNGTSGSGANQSTPVKVSQSSMTASGKVTQLAAGYYHSLVLTESGDIYAWGWNNYGQLGNGNTTNQSAPAKVSQSSMTASGKVTQLAAGYYHSLVLTESGDIYAWGSNSSGQLGNGTSGSGANQSTPVKVSQSSMTASGKVIQLTAGSSHSLALTESGDIYAWGYNNSGQLGNGTIGSGTSQSTPVKTLLGEIPSNELISLTVDGIVITNFTVNPDDTVTFTAPPRNAGKYDIILTYADNRTVTIPQGLLYVADLQPNVPGAPNTGMQIQKNNLASVIIITGLLTIGGAIVLIRKI